MNQFSTWNDQTLLILAFLVRLFLILYARIHDYIFKLNFTDVDYEVFTEAAHFAWKGLSPYSLSTYRYPPIIAWILIPNNLFSDFGKIIFSILDISVGWIQLKYINEIYTRDKYRKINQRHLICFLWLFNPFNAIIATRGNSDSLICFLNIWTMFELFKGNFFLSAILHGGLATHLRLFPIIYLPSIFIYLSDYNNKCGKGLRSFIFYFLHNKRGFLFIFTSICSFLCSTLFCYRIYGQEFINSSLLYHLTRIDVSHNFSPYFFPLYLAMNNQVLTKFIGIFAFLPQIICNVLFAIRFSNDLPFCWFLTTFAFVSFNKVSTSQYFIWYLCFLPLIFHNIKFNLRKAFSLLALWLIAQGFWLLNAYLFEFCGYNTLTGIWVASLLFLITNCYIMIQFINDYLLFKHNKLQEKSE